MTDIHAADCVMSVKLCTKLYIYIYYMWQSQLENEHYSGAGNENKKRIETDMESGNDLYQFIFTDVDYS